MSRNTWIVVVAAIALLAFAVWKSRAPVEHGISRLSFASVDSAAIDRIEIGGKSPCTLVRAGEAWTVDGKEADPNAVKALVESIPKVVSSDQLTADAAKFADLGVDAASGTSVKAFAGGKTVAELTAGKPAAGGMNVLSGGAVFFVPKLFPGSFVREKKAWGDRKLFKDPAAQVTRVDVKRAGEKPWSLQKTGETWAITDPSVLPKGFRFDASAARAMATALANVQADELPDADPGAAATGLDAETADHFTFVVGTSGTISRELVIGSEKDAAAKTSWARASTRPYPVALTTQSVTALRKAPTDLREMTMMSFDRAKVQKVAVDDGTNRWVLTKGKDGWKLDSHSEKLPDGFELDPSAGDRKIAALLGARGQKLAPADESFVASGAKVVATLEGGATATLSFGATKKDEAGAETLEVRGNADGATYLAAPGLKSSLTASVATLRKQAQPPGGGFDPHQLSSLPPDVREALMKQQAQQQQQQQLMEMIQKKQAAAAASPAPTGH